MKVHILFRFKNGPWGGGNQFLKALRSHLQSKGLYQAVPESADVILFNSYPFSSERLYWELYQIKNRFPDKIIVLRIDGPTFFIRNRDLEVDKIIFNFNKNISDGIIFQSTWSRLQCIKLGFVEQDNQTTIVNAPNSKYFNKIDRKTPSTDGKIRIISTSWSANWRKGFGVYKWLDDNLDFSRYEMTFVGNSPIEFKNINHIPPLSTELLAVELKKNHIYLTASQKDPCSNAVLEALHCGLPLIALNDGGHPELGGAGGEYFNKPEEIPGLLETISGQYADYVSKVQVANLQETGNAYVDFMAQIINKVKRKEYTPKVFSMKKLLILTVLIVSWKIKRRMLQE